MHFINILCVQLITSITTTQCLANLIMGETALLQKARPFGALRETRWLLPPEFLFIYPLYVFDPIAAVDIQPAFDKAALDTLLLQLSPDVERSITARATHMQQRLNKAFVRDQSFGN